MILSCVVYNRRHRWFNKNRHDLRIRMRDFESGFAVRQTGSPVGDFVEPGLCHLDGIAHQL